MNTTHKSTLEQTLLDLGAAHQLVQHLRVSAPRNRTLGERVQRWTAWRQTLKSRSTARCRAHGIPCRTTARRAADAADLRSLSPCELVQKSTCFMQPAALKEPVPQDWPDARDRRIPTAKYVTTITHFSCFTLALSPFAARSQQQVPTSHGALVHVKYHSVDRHVIHPIDINPTPQQAFASSAVHIDVRLVWKQHSQGGQFQGDADAGVLC